LSKALVKRELMRDEKREFAWEFSQLACPGQTRTRVAWELMRDEKREFAWEFSQLACPGQTRTRVVRELMRVDWIYYATRTICRYTGCIKKGNRTSARYCISITLRTSEIFSYSERSVF
jgi:hypothetical protein